MSETAIFISIGIGAVVLILFAVMKASGRGKNLEVFHMDKGFLPCPEAEGSLLEDKGGDSGMVQLRFNRDFCSFEYVPKCPGVSLEGFWSMIEKMLAASTAHAARAWAPAGEAG